MKNYLKIAWMKLFGRENTSEEHSRRKPAKQPDPLAGTTWKQEWETGEYQTYSFLQDGTCEYVLHIPGQEDRPLPLEWVCTASGHVKTRVQLTGKKWKEGRFDSRKNTLLMEQLLFRRAYEAKTRDSRVIHG